MAKVCTPTSSANMSVGFDVLRVVVMPVDGALFEDVATVRAVETLSLNNLKRFADKLPSESRENTVYQRWEHFYQKPGEQVPVVMILEKNTPVGSGLGFSACPVVAALMAMDEHCGKPISDTRLLALVGKLEGRISNSIRRDSVAPRFLGGMQLMIGENDIISQQMPGFDEWLWVLAYSGIKVSTAEAGAISPAQYRRQDCIAHGQHLAGFIHACHPRQPRLTTKLIEDIIAEPCHERLPSDFRQAWQAVAEIGAVASGIPGPDPTLFALCDKPDTTRRVADWLGKDYL